MVQTPTKPRLDSWTVATWDEFLRLVEDPAYEKAKGYRFDTNPKSWHITEFKLVQHQD